MTIERRQDRRYMLTRPIKMQADPAGLRCLPGRTVNISAGGALLEVESPQRLSLGQDIRLAIASVAHQAMFRSGDFTLGTVIRCLGCNQRQHVAVRFHNPHLIAEAS